MAAAAWRARADDELLVGMPSRRRILLEAALLLSLVFSEAVLLVSPWAAAIVLAAELALAMALVRPWAKVHGGLLARSVAVILVVLGVLAPAMVERPELAGPSRMLGVGVLAASREPGDPPGSGGVVRVERVEPRSPADGVLRVGDRIVALDGTQLDDKDPTGDLTRRTHGDELPEDTRVTVIRDHAAKNVPVRIPRLRDPRQSFGRRIGALRDLASRHLVVAAAARGLLIVALLLLLLRADGQPLAAIGLVRKGALRELVAGTWMTAGTFAVQVAVAIPIGIIGMLAGIMNSEAAQRTEALGTIAGQGSVVDLVVPLFVAAAFEEIAFRGFLLPRARALFGSWVPAVVVVSVVFGLGHVYEGPLAIVQTAALGAYFSAMLLLRRRLLGPIVAHAAFNLAILAFVRFALQSGLLDQMKHLSPPH